MSSLFRVGVVTTAHGIRGAVKVYPTTDDPRRFLDLEKVRSSRTGEEEDICCQSNNENVQFIKNLVILSLKEVKDRNLAEAMKGGSFWISDEEALPLEDDEFYIRDFMEATVKDEEGNPVVQGKVKMAINISSQGVLDNIKYKDAQYVGLTHENVNDKLVIDYEGSMLKVLYINPKGRYKQVFLSEI